MRVLKGRGAPLPPNEPWVKCNRLRRTIGQFHGGDVERSFSPRSNRFCNNLAAANQGVARY